MVTIARLRPSGPRSRPQDAGEWSLEERVRRLFRLGTIAAAAAALALALTNVVNNRVLASPLYNLNPDLEMTPWSWASSSLTFGAAATALTMVLVGVAPRRLLVLAASLAYLSLDDAIAIHERAAAWLVAHGVPDGIDGTLWPALFLPVFAAAALLLLDVAATTPAGGRFLIVTGLGLLAFALFSEAVWGLWYAGGGGDAQGWPNTIEVALEEGAELAAWTLIFTALVGTAARAVATPPPLRFSSFVDTVGRVLRSGGKDRLVAQPGESPEPVRDTVPL